eukprot:6175010-Pleurochrysis_carterae.AAC.4
MRVGAALRPRRAVCVRARVRVRVRAHVRVRVRVRMRMYAGGCMRTDSAMAERTFDLCLSSVKSAVRSACVANRSCSTRRDGERGSEKKTISYLEAEESGRCAPGTALGGSHQKVHHASDWTCDETRERSELVARAAQAATRASLGVDAALCVTGAWLMTKVQRAHARDFD